MDGAEVGIVKEGLLVIGGYVVGSLLITLRWWLKDRKAEQS